MDRDCEHVVFLSCSQTMWCRKECNKEMHQNKRARVESVRADQGSPLPLETIPLRRRRTPLDDLSLGEIRLLTPGAAFAT